MLPVAGVLAEYSHPPGYWPTRTLNGSALTDSKGPRILDGNDSPCTRSVLFWEGQRAISLLFDKIGIGLGGKIEGVALQDWAQPLLTHPLMVSGDTEMPPEGPQTPVATLAGLKTCR